MHAATNDASWRCSLFNAQTIDRKTKTLMATSITTYETNEYKWYDAIVFLILLETLKYFYLLFSTRKTSRDFLTSARVYHQAHILLFNSTIWISGIVFRVLVTVDTVLYRYIVSTIIMKKLRMHDRCQTKDGRIKACPTMLSSFVDHESGTFTTAGRVRILAYSSSRWLLDAPVLQMYDTESGQAII
jgi:hypothetical protein